MSPDNPTFAPAIEAASEVGVDATITRIREEYQGVPHRSPRAIALTDITTLMGLYVKCGGGKPWPVTIYRNIIARRGEASEEYKVASDGLSELTAACLGKGDKLFESATALRNKLHVLVDDLYPEHAQRVASAPRQS